MVVRQTDRYAKEIAYRHKVHWRVFEGFEPGLMMKDGGWTSEKGEREK